MSDRPALRYGLAGGSLALLAIFAYAVTSLVTGSGTPTHADDPPATPAGPTAEPNVTPDTTATARYWEHPGRTVTPDPGATPDRSQAWWFVPYVNADRAKPVFEGELNGFRIEFGADDRREVCTSQAEWLDATHSRGTVMDVFPPSLPEGSIAEHGTVESGLATVCEGEILHAFATFTVPGEPPEGRLGGSITVVRMRADPVISSVTAPEDRWETGTIAGLPAVIARPILPDIGLRNSAVAVYDESQRLLTLVTATGMPLHVLLDTVTSLFE